MNDADFKKFANHFIDSMEKAGAWIKPEGKHPTPWRVKDAQGSEEIGIVTAFIVEDCNGVPITVVSDRDAAKQIVKAINDAAFEPPDQPISTSCSEWRIENGHLYRNDQEVGKLAWTGNPATMGHSLEVNRFHLDGLLGELQAARAENARWRYTGGRQQHLVICNGPTNGPIGGPGCICTVVSKWDVKKMEEMEKKAAETKPEAPVAIQWNHSGAVIRNEGFAAFIRCDKKTVGQLWAPTEAEVEAIAEKFVASLNFCEGTPVDCLLGSAQGAVKHIEVLKTALIDANTQIRELTIQRDSFENLAASIEVENESLRTEIDTLNAFEFPYAKEHERAWTFSVIEGSLMGTLRYKSAMVADIDHITGKRICNAMNFLANTPDNVIDPGAKSIRPGFTTSCQIWRQHTERLKAEKDKVLTQLGQAIVGWVAEDMAATWVKYNAIHDRSCPRFNCVGTPSENFRSCTCKLDEVLAFIEKHPFPKVILDINAK
jgi:hypothetical protein